MRENPVFAAEGAGRREGSTAGKRVVGEALLVQVTSEQKPKAKEGGSWRVSWDTDLQAEGHHAGSRETGVCLAYAWYDEGTASPPASRSGVRMGDKPRAPASLLEPASWSRDLRGHTGPHAEKDSEFTLMLCCRHFETRNSFCKRGPALNFAVGSINYVFGLLLAIPLTEDWPRLLSKPVRV